MTPKFLSFCLLGNLAGFISASLGSEAIVGGQTAKVNQFPYQVSLWYDDDYVCGGGIIGHDLILTAAHCVVQLDGKLRRARLTVRAGTNDRENDAKPAVSIQVKEVFTLREFNVSDASTTADIAVLKLKHQLVMSRNIQKLDLPKNEDESYAGQIATVAGWGFHWVEIYDRVHVRGGANDSQLQFAPSRILSTSDCQQGYKLQKISNKHICARIIQRKNQKRGVCTDDSGSPLVIDGKIVVGILSRNAFGCEERFRASIYTRVSHYLQFIEQAMQLRTTNDMRSLQFSS